MESSQGMKTFTNKVFSAAAKESDSIRSRIDLDSDLNKVIKSFFEYIDKNVANAPTNSTGRKYPMKSTMANSIFGEELAMLLYEVLNKFAYNASGT